MGVIVSSGKAVQRSGIALPVPTSAGAYAVGDHVGVGGPFPLDDLLLTSLFHVDPDQRVAIHRVHLVDRTAENERLVLLIWSDKPSGTMVDGASTALPTADSQLVIGHVEIPAAAYLTNPSTGSHAQIVLAQPIIVASPGDAYFSLMSLGTPTYGGVELLLRVDAHMLCP